MLVSTLSRESGPPAFFLGGGCPSSPGDALRKERDHSPFHSSLSECLFRFQLLILAHTLGFVLFFSNPPKLLIPSQCIQRSPWGSSA